MVEVAEAYGVVRAVLVRKEEVFSVYGAWR